MVTTEKTEIKEIAPPALVKILTTKEGGFLRQIYTAKLKDKFGREGFVIANKNPKDKYIVIKEIAVKKIAGETNKLEVVLTMPDPETVEVVELPKTIELDSKGGDKK